MTSSPLGQSYHRRSLGGPSIVRADAPLRAPLSRGLRRKVAAALERGERRILVDLSRIPSIDAAGVGELVRAFNAARAAGGALQIAYANPRVERLLRLAGLFPMLSAGLAISTRRFDLEYHGRAG